MAGGRGRAGGAEASGGVGRDLVSGGVGREASGEVGQAASGEVDHSAPAACQADWACCQTEAPSCGPVTVNPGSPG